MLTYGVNNWNCSFHPNQFNNDIFVLICLLKDVPLYDFCSKINSKFFFLQIIKLNSLQVSFVFLTIAMSTDHSNCSPFVPIAIFQMFNFFYKNINCTKT